MLVVLVVVGRLDAHSRAPQLHSTKAHSRIRATLVGKHDSPKAARLTRLGESGQLHALNVARIHEEVPKVILRNVIRQVAHKDRGGAAGATTRLACVIRPPPVVTAVVVANINAVALGRARGARLAEGSFGPWAGTEIGLRGGRGTRVAPAQQPRHDAAALDVLC